MHNNTLFQNYQKSDDFWSSKNQIATMTIVTENQFLKSISKKLEKFGQNCQNIFHEKQTLNGFRNQSS